MMEEPEAAVIIKSETGRLRCGNWESDASIKKHTRETVINAVNAIADRFLIAVHEGRFDDAIQLLSPKIKISAATFIADVYEDVGSIKHLRFNSLTYHERSYTVSYLPTELPVDPHERWSYDVHVSVTPSIAMIGFKKQQILWSAKYDHLYAPDPPDLIW